MRLEIDGLRKEYGGQSVLDIPHFACEFTHCLALIGPSGGGKSTLLRLLGGLEKAEAGSIRINGTALPSDEAGLHRHRCRVGTVFQAFNLFPHLTALENITLPLTEVHGLQREEAVARAASYLARFGLAEHAAKRPSQLSGGQRQRVAIARAVAIDPEFLLLDESTSALDPEMTAEVLELLVELRGEDRPLILVTHEIGFARQAADQVAFLENKRIAACEKGPVFFQSPPTPSARQFLQKTLHFA